MSGAPLHGISTTFDLPVPTATRCFPQAVLDLAPANPHPRPVDVDGLTLGAVWAVRIINHTLPPNTLSVPAVEMDATVLWFALGLTIVTGLLFGIMPAWRTARVDLNVVLRSAGRGSCSRMSVRLRTALAAAELALATVLLIGAGLFIRSLANLQGVRLGFAPHKLITFQLSPPTQKYPLATKAPQLYRQVLDSLQTIPGVRGVGVSSGIPFGAGTYSKHPMLTTGQSVLPPGTLVPIDWRIASPGYFKTMGIPLVEGRDFTDADNATALPVTIVSQATAKKFWGDADPIGQTLRRSAAPAIAFTVVGVVGPMIRLPVATSSLRQIFIARNGYPYTWHSELALKSMMRLISANSTTVVLALFNLKNSQA